MKIFVAALLLLGAGCAETPAVKTTFNVQTLRLKDEPRGTDDVRFAVAVVTPENLRENFKGLLFEVRYPSGSNMAATGGEAAGTVAILPLPMLVVRVFNNTATPVSFAQAHFALVDDKGKQWQPFKDLGEVELRVENDMVAQFPATIGQQSLLAQLRDDVDKLSIFDQHTVVAPKTDRQGFLVFKLDVHNLAELDSYLQTIGSLTLTITNITGAPDLKVPLDKTTVSVTATCPGGPGKAPPKLSECKHTL